jgi:hypothetical protein
MLADGCRPTQSPFLCACPVRSQVPNGGAGFYLLGRIHQLSNRHSAAIAYYSTALQLDPMLWCAFEELCGLGADHEAQQYLAAAAAGATAGCGGGHVAPGSSAAAFAGGGPGQAGAGPSSSAAASPMSFQQVATPSQHAGAAAAAPAAAAPVSTAATRPTGLGAMLSWMDSGRRNAAHHTGGASQQVRPDGCGPAFWACVVSFV